MKAFTTLLLSAITLLLVPPSAGQLKGPMLNNSTKHEARLLLHKHRRKSDVAKYIAQIHAPVSQAIASASTNRAVEAIVKQTILADFLVLNAELLEHQDPFSQAFLLGAAYCFTLNADCDLFDEEGMHILEEMSGGGLEFDP